jgi:FtsP/CotA-like multicopper oxidase with cupredoxin domain
MLSASNTQFLPPFPDGLIVNEGQNANINFVKGKTYRIRLISFSAIASAMVHFDSHTMQVIMNDGSYIRQTQATRSTSAHPSATTSSSRRSTGTVAITPSWLLRI